MTSPREAAVRATYEEDPSDFSERAEVLLHPEVEWQTNWPGFAPAVHGIEGVRQWREAISDPWERIRFDVRELIEVDEETVFVWVHGLARRTESAADVEMNAFDVLTFRDDRVLLRRSWFDRAEAIAAAGID